MKKLLRSAIYLVAISLLSNLLGGCISRRFRTDVFPFKSYPFERDGKIYDKLHIRKWKNKVPDMSKYLRSLPRKELVEPTCGRINLLVQETCVAELVHSLLILLSFVVLIYWPDWRTVLLVVVYDVVGNLPFIMIQRYNRPRLLRLAAKLERTGSASDGTPKKKEPVLDDQVAV